MGISILHRQQYKSFAMRPYPSKSTSSKAITQNNEAHAQRRIQRSFLPSVPYFQNVGMRP
jgi:hypothetical protein